MPSPLSGDSSHLISCSVLTSPRPVCPAAAKLSALRLSLGLGVFGSLLGVFTMPAVAQSSRDSGLLALGTHANLSTSEENVGENAVSPQINLLELSQFAGQVNQAGWVNQTKSKPLPEGALKQPTFSIKAEIGGVVSKVVADQVTADESRGNEAGSEVTVNEAVDSMIHEAAHDVVPLDDELGGLRVRQLRSRDDEELGILRLLQTAQAAPARPKPPTAFLGARIGYLGSENPFRNRSGLSDQIYQSGLGLYLFPRLSDNTNLYAIADTSLIRYETFESINYNELEFQLGIRQRLFPRTYAQIGWRNQRLFSPGYRDTLFTINAIDTLISHRLLLNPQLWLDSFYQLRLGFANPSPASRFRQTFTLSLNYGVARNLRAGLLYQLDLDDYTQIPRYDTYQQVLGIISYNLTPESRLSFFGGTRFGRSSEPSVNLSDTFYGAGLNVSVPLF